MTGDREYQRTTGPVYERAFGGFDYQEPEPRRQRLDTRNPVGRGCAIRAGRLIRTPVASRTMPGVPLTTGPAEVESIASQRSLRREHAGTYDARWAAKRRPLLPEGFDPRHHQHAPVDPQVTPHLRAGERVELVNLTPDGVLRFEMPKLGPAMTTPSGSKPRCTTVSVPRTAS